MSISEVVCDPQNEAFVKAYYFACRVGRVCRYLKDLLLTNNKV